VKIFAENSMQPPFSHDIYNVFPAGELRAKIFISRNKTGISDFEVEMVFVKK
jgi:hypothetical protein